MSFAFSLVYGQKFKFMFIFSLKNAFSTPNNWLANGLLKYVFPNIYIWSLYDCFIKYPDIVSAWRQRSHFLIPQSNQYVAQTKKSSKMSIWDEKISCLGIHFEAIPFGMGDENGARMKQNWPCVNHCWNWWWVHGVDYIIMPTFVLFKNFHNQRAFLICVWLIGQQEREWLG